MRAVKFPGSARGAHARAGDEPRGFDDEILIFFRLTYYSGSDDPRSWPLLNNKTTIRRRRRRICTQPHLRFAFDAVLCFWFTAWLRKGGARRWRFQPTGHGPDVFCELGICAAVRRYQLHPRRDWQCWSSARASLRIRRDHV